MLTFLLLLDAKLAPQLVLMLAVILGPSDPLYEAIISLCICLSFPNCVPRPELVVDVELRELIRPLDHVERRVSLPLEVKYLLLAVED